MLFHVEMIYLAKQAKCVYHLSTCKYVSVHENLSLITCASTQISLRIFKVSPEFGCSHTLQSMGVDKDKTKF